ncbi:imidazole glycerol phosphate synthase subunit HisH [Aristophania vespae]|uniref:Imidazole glycerol phosphate synthase subunit HisH n=1 Tax=Aristophania vespae TaxID=2697033 RepID=A0A6P1NET9_9PROT|nr:imidazole glycerol phosphate synthase subunit HisH [Aristophania vespae]QHI95968.1 imidazole glycerol phosphate synthase subunit HisH [Aristophania vespae]UMM63723.1 Imidazole glycerol phosphate synthase subunit HisH [Aristophania vespae]
MRVVVIDYNGGNLASAAQATKRAASQLGLNADIRISRQESDILSADRLILPGQGAFADCARGLEIDNLRKILEQTVEKGTAFLGICVGMQLMAEYGLEHGKTPGLGWIKGYIAPMSEAEEAGLRLPHMGWNELNFTKGAHPLTEGLSPKDHAYFVHSYALKNGASEDIIATADYGSAVPAIVARGCQCGTQFHVEKSQEVGLTILRNFLSWAPRA